MRIIGGRLFDVCRDCGGIVRLDKPLFGSLHICTTDEEREAHPRKIWTEYKRMKAKFDHATD